MMLPTNISSGERCSDMTTSNQELLEEITREALIKRINNSYSEMERLLSTSLYADGPAAPKPTRRQRFVRYLSVRRDRIRDAWLVLTGQADIDGGW